MSRKIFVTSALPNANGPIHLGHMLEHIQTDIWVRFQRMRGNEVVYACADATHGTATMLKAEEEGTTPSSAMAPPTICLAIETQVDLGFGITNLACTLAVSSTRLTKSGTWAPKRESCLWLWLRMVVDV